MKEGTINVVHASPTPRVEIWGEESIDLTAFLQSKGLSASSYTVYAATTTSIGYTTAVERVSDEKVHFFKLDDIKAFQMKQKESIMPKEGLNVLTCLAQQTEQDTYGTVAAATQKLNEFKAGNKPCAIIFMGGAGANIDKFKKLWMDAGLGGCTQEIVTIEDLLKHFNVIIINTMTPQQQLAANAVVKEKKNVGRTGMNVINDPEKHFFKLLGMEDNVDLLHIIGPEGDRQDAYKPQAYICNSDSVIQKVIKNNNFTPGNARESGPYVDEIKNALLAEHAPKSYQLLRSNLAAETATSSNRPGSPGRN